MRSEALFRRLLYAVVVSVTAPLPSAILSKKRSRFWLPMVNSEAVGAGTAVKVTLPETPGTVAGSTSMV